MVTHRNVADHLGAMVTTGLYDIAMVENEFGRYGFAYDRDTDEIVHVASGRRAHLGSRSPAELRAELANDARERDTLGWINNNTPADARLVDAISISQAVYLTLTGTPPPSLGYTDRTKGFRRDVQALTLYLALN